MSTDASPRRSEMETKVSKKMTSPVGIAVACNCKPYPWQSAVLKDLCEPGWVALRAANESGKTTSVGTFISLWHGMAFPKGKIVITSGSWRQVENQFMPALTRYGNRVQGWEFTKHGFKTKAGGFLIGFSTDDGGRFEGWHGEPDAPLLMIVDEAKTVPDTIFHAIERCRPDRLLLMSSPGASTGFFYEAFNRMSDRFKRHTVTAYDCPHIPAERIETQIKTWGKDHPLVRSMIFGEFMDTGSEMYVIPFTMLEKCLANPPGHIPFGDPVAFCDFAAGGDENVLAIRRGNKVENLICWRDANTMSAVGRFIIEFRKSNLKDYQIWGDEGGLGKPMIDAMHEAGWYINRCNNGFAANLNDKFGNRGAEMWYETKRQIERNEIILPKDEALRVQLTTRKAKIDSKGRMHVESKEDMRARGLGSPDRADAVCGCVANIPVQAIATSMTFDDVFGQNEQSERSPRGVLAGAWAG